VPATGEDKVLSSPSRPENAKLGARGESKQVNQMQDVTIMACITIIITTTTIIIIMITIIIIIIIIIAMIIIITKMIMMIIIITTTILITIIITTTITIIITMTLIIIITTTIIITILTIIIIISTQYRKEICTSNARDWVSNGRRCRRKAGPRLRRLSRGLRSRII